MSNILGTSFARSGFTWDPNLSPNNQSFSSAVLAVALRYGFTTQAGTGGGGTATLSGPTNKVSTTSTAGTSTAAMRSDGAPAIDQAMAPVWTGVHSFATSVQYTAITAPSAPSNGTLKLAAVTSLAANITQLTAYDAFGASIALGYENHMVVYNAGTATFTAGSVAYVNGAHSKTPTIDYAKADSATTMPCVGIAQYAIPPASYGVIHMFGIVSATTNSFSVGDTLYVSDTIAGAMQNTVPAAGHYAQTVGVVTLSAGAGAGSIQFNAKTSKHAVLQPGYAYGTGDILYAPGSTSLTTLPIGAAGRVLGVAAGVPSWISPHYAGFAFDSVFYAQAGGL